MTEPEIGVMGAQIAEYNTEADALERALQQLVPQALWHVRYAWESGGAQDLGVLTVVVRLKAQGMVLTHVQDVTRERAQRDRNSVALACLKKLIDQLITRIDAKGNGKGGSCG